MRIFFYLLMLFICIGLVLVYLSQKDFNQYFPFHKNIKLLHIYQNKSYSQTTSTISTHFSISYNNIVIIQLTNQKQNKVYAESIRNKEIYAKKQNYTVFVDEPGSERHPVWYKCISILKAINKTQPNDWIWMVDSDTYITNMNIELNRLTSYATQHNYHMIINKDCSNINAGYILFRNSHLSIQFINDVWNSLGKEVDVKDEWREQRGIIILANRTEYRDYILWVPQTSLNSYPKETTCQLDREWRVGDFLIHFAGNRNEALFFQYVDKAKKISNNDLKQFNTANWLKFINEWRKKNNFTLLI